MEYDRLELVSIVQGHLPYFQNYMHKGAPMTSKKRKPEEPAHAADPAPESAVQTKETAEEYIARKYGEAIRAGNVSRMLEGILVEIVKWRMGK